MDTTFSLVPWGYEPAAVRERFESLEQQHGIRVSGLHQELVQLRAQTAELQRTVDGHEAAWQRTVQAIESALQAPPAIPSAAVAHLRRRINAHAARRAELEAELAGRRAVHDRLSRLCAALATELERLSAHVSAAVADIPATWDEAP